MKFTKTPIEGAYIIEIDKKEDDRGFFARTFCVNEFKELGLETNFVQTNTSFNHKKGTIRGLHFQKDPFGEVKLMRCINGEMYDVIVDIRPSSKTYMKWFGIKLTAENRTSLYIPKGCANGYQALTDGATALYSSSTFYEPSAEAGVRYNDPAIKIEWPIPENIIVSEKDKQLPLITAFV